MCKAVEQRGRHLRISEHGRPFAEAEIRRDDDAGPLVKFAQKMEEQGAAGGAERQVAQLVEDDEVGVGEARRDLSWFALQLFLLERVDEFDSGEEPDALAVLLDGLDADRRGEMRLASAGAADQDDVVRIFQELAAMELSHKRFVDLAAGEVEAGEIAVVREARRLRAFNSNEQFNL